MTTKNQAMQIFNDMTDSVEFIEKQLSDLISNHNYCKNSYFWSPRTSVKQRRKKELEYSRDITFNLDSGLLTVEQTMSLSYKHAYYSMDINVLGTDNEQHEKFGAFNYNLTTLKQLSDLVQQLKAQAA